MAIFYTIFDALCSERGILPAKVSKDTGIAQSTIASWKSRKLNPNAKTLQKLAEYFNVSTEYLLTGDESKRSRIYPFLKENIDPPPETTPEQDEIDKKRLEEQVHKLAAPLEQQKRKIEKMVALSEESEAFLKLYNEFLSPRGRQKVHRYAEDLITNPENLLRGIAPLKKSPADGSE